MGDDALLGGRCNSKKEGQYGSLKLSRRRRTKTSTIRTFLWWTRWKAYVRAATRSVPAVRARRALLAWQAIVQAGGYMRPAIVDEEEALFGELDLKPLERKEERHRLREFLWKGQEEWSKDGGVKPRPKEPEPRLESLHPFMRTAKQRRPAGVISLDMGVTDYVGTFWELSDFDGADQEIVAMLTKTQGLEREVVEHFRKHRTFAGDNISAEGCASLGIPEEKIREWTQGVDFDVDPNLESYSKPPYPVIYSSMSLLVMAAEECMLCLRLGKILPTRWRPWIENRILAIIKIAPLEPSGIKWRTCVDMTASGVNDATTNSKFRLPTIEDIISALGRRGYIVKQDPQDMFWNWKIHPSKWVLFGFQHPITGQSYIYPVLPFGFRLSPSLACANTQLMADMIEAEARRRAMGEVGLAVLVDTLTQHLTEPSSEPLPASRVYVDDFQNMARDLLCTQELANLAGRIFELIGVIEKVLKREGPAQALVLLGFLFDTVTGLLSIPEDKSRAILAMIDDVLHRADNRQSVSWSEFSNLIGKLTWAATGVEIGRAYLRNMRKPCTAVLPTLLMRNQREVFCIPLYLFPKALEELRWWKRALECNGGRVQWHVGKAGTYELWRWFGLPEEAIPKGVLQFATDSSRFGGGGVFELERLTRKWTRAELRHHINVLEAVMILHVLIVWGRKFAGQRVIAWCDNTVSVQAINKGVGASDMINGIIRRIRLRCLELGISLWVCHIPGAINLDPDALSRGVMARRIEDWSLILQCMRKWTRLYGPFTVDAYADPSCFNSQAPVHCSSVDPPTPDKLKGENVWAFPPPSLSEQFVEDSASWECRSLVAVIPSVRAAELGSDWEVLQTYEIDSQTCRRYDGEQWVRCTNLGLPLAVVRRLSLA